MPANPTRTLPHLFSALRLSLRASIAAGIAIALAGLLGLEHPLYAMIGAVIVTDLSPERTRRTCLQRIVGTVIGATIGAVLSAFLPAGPVGVALAILAALFLSHALRLPDAAKLAGYVCGIVVLEHHDQPWIYAGFRLAETLLGIGAALLVSVVPKLVDVPDAGPDDS